MATENLLVQDSCDSVEEIIACLKGETSNNTTQLGAVNSTETGDVIGGCNPHWMLSRCIPAAKYGETQEVPCAFVLYSDGIDQIFKPDGVGSISAYCNETTEFWSVEQTCVINTALRGGNSSIPAGMMADNGTVNPQDEDNTSNLLSIYTTLRFITTGGHALSLISLIIAILLFACMRRLHCMRVTIHINLMVTFLLRAVLWYLHFPVTHEGDYDIEVLSRIFGQKHNATDIPWLQTVHDENCVPKSYYSWCRVHTIFLNYTILANNFWILIEGIYLWILLQAFSMPTRKTMVGFLIFGWICPWIPITIYCLQIDLNAKKKECWNVEDCKNPHWWILKTPMLISLVTNFVFFIMVLKIVASKLRFNHSSNTQGTSNSYKWRLAKATLSLIPLLGISYLLTMFVQCNSYENTEVIIVKYFENFFNSVQGFLVAVIYCFLNTEIREEFAKLRRSWQLKKELGRMRTDQRPQASSMGNYYNQDASNVTNMTSWSERERPDEGVSITLLPVITNGKQQSNKENHLSPAVSLRNGAARTDRPSSEAGSQISAKEFSNDGTISQNEKLIDN